MEKVDALERKEFISLSDGIARSVPVQPAKDGKTVLDSLVEIVLEAQKSTDGYVKLCAWLAAIQLGDVMDGMEWCEFLGQKVSEAEPVSDGVVV